MSSICPAWKAVTPFEDYLTINKELKEYDERLSERPQMVVANKMDMPEAEEHLNVFRKKLSDDIQVFPISAITRQGLKEWLFALADLLERIPKENLYEPENEDRVVYKFEKEEEPFQISRDPDGAFVLSGDRIEKLFKMTDFSRDESIQRFSRKLRKMGVDDALRKKGAKDGDTVRLLEYEFEFVE